ncbi:MAG: FAD-dependent oxidoreductase, partial [Clostridiales Family XIII bacterium]|nr:FAD-dependent oxidoreductase [Clostridiales Family XIII bacterium]
AGDEFFTLHGRRGGILIFDKAVKAPFSRSVSTVAMNNDSMSKGGGFSFTPEGNIIAGPSAMESADREDGAVFPEDIEYAYSRGASIWSGLRRQDIIAMYAGVRAADFKEDFIITLGRSTSGILHVAGIQSPGLASAPAIAEMALKLIAKHRNKAKEDFSLKNTYNPLRPSPVEFRTLTDEEKDALIRKRPEFGNVICRCEEITEGEILEAIRSPIVPTTVDAIKRRTRAGMGRCQGGFCQPRVVEILARELGKDWTDIMLKGREAYILDRDSRNGDADMTKEAAR